MNEKTKIKTLEKEVRSLEKSVNLLLKKRKR